MGFWKEWDKPGDPDTGFHGIETPSHIESAIEEISVQVSDPTMHYMEDNLRDVVLKLIAKGRPDSAVLAAAVLKTGDINIARYYG